MKKTLNRSKKRIIKTWDKSLQPYTIKFVKPFNIHEIRNVVWAKNRNKAWELASDLYPDKTNVILLQRSVVSHFKNTPTSERITKVSKKQKALADKITNELIKKDWKRLHPEDFEINNRWSSILKAASGDIRRLSYVNRYSSIPTLIKENTAEHLAYTAIYAILIHNELEGKQSIFCGETEAYIMLHALTHDFSDMISGDLVRVFKYAYPEFTTAVHKAEELMVKKLDKSLLSLCKHVDTNMDWYIKSVVKAADFMSLYEYLWREKNMGNKEVEQFFQRMLADMKMMQQKLLKEKVEPEFNKYKLALSDLYGAMGNGIFHQDFVTS